MATDGTISSLWRFLHRDHLGSVDVIATNTGAVSQKTSFDPFGGRREATWGSDLTTASLNTLLGNEDQFSPREFTDHEMLNRTGFVHMNGRVFDPRIGRFVSPDPIVQAPFFSQSYNRYAYVMNNPLSLIDPSGFEASDGDKDDKNKVDDGRGGSAGGSGSRSIETVTVAAPRIQGNSGDALIDLLNGRGPSGATVDEMLEQQGIEDIIRVVVRRPGGRPTTGIFDSRGNFRGPVIRNHVLGTAVPITFDYDADFAEYYFTEAVKGLAAGAFAWRGGQLTVYLVGPRGPLFGNTYYRGKGNAGLLNHGRVRLGWSFNQTTGRVNFSLRIGDWHSDKYFNPISFTPSPK